MSILRTSKLDLCPIFQFIVRVGLDNDFFLLKHPPRTNLKKTEGAFSNIAPHIWNELPYHIRCMTELSSFKKCLKSYYFDIAFDGISDRRKQ